MDRRCRICGKDISDLHGNAVYCVKHRTEAQKIKKQKRNNMLSPDQRQAELESKRKAERDRVGKMTPEQKDARKKAQADWYANKKKNDPDWWERRKKSNRVQES